MKRTICIFILIMFSLGSNASDRKMKRFSFGAEWGYIASFHCGIHHNFFSEEGYRVDLTQQNFWTKGNGETYIHAGINLNPSWNISLYTGLAGIYDFHKAIPISLRATRYIDCRKRTDKWLIFADAGSGVCLTSEIQGIVTGKMGGGYKIVLSPDTSLDLLIAYRMTLTHPEITYDGYEIQPNRINRNNAYVSAVSLSLSLNF